MSQPKNEDFKLEDLVDLAVSHSLCCSYCNTKFENKLQQRLHYKLEWHRFNIKQHLCGLKSVSELEYNKFLQNIDINSKIGLDKVNIIDIEKNSDSDIPFKSFSDKKNNKKIFNNVNFCKTIIENLNEKPSDYQQLNSHNTMFSLSFDNYHAKILFQNSEGRFFSIYRCLLYSKKVIIIKL